MNQILNAPVFTQSGAKLEVENPRAYEIVNVYRALTQVGSYAAFVGNEPQVLVSEGLITAADLRFINGAVLTFEPPWTHRIEFDKSFNQGLLTWLKTDAKNVITSFAEWDPWAAYQPELNNDPTNRHYTMAEGSHSTPLEDLDPADLSRLKEDIHRYLPPKTKAFNLSLDSSVEKQKARREMRAESKRTQLY